MTESRLSLTTTVRLATAADAPRLAELRWEFRAGRAARPEPQDAFLRRCTAWMIDRLESTHWRCWVAVRAEGIVGQVWVHVVDKIPNPSPEPESHAYITNMYVQPAARGGTGGALLDAALRWCESQDLDYILLWPTERSRSLYMRKGFNSTPAIMNQQRPRTP
jgi:GNAT superfamily N-acetyltransferase